VGQVSNLPRLAGDRAGWKPAPLVGGHSHLKTAVRKKTMPIKQTPDRNYEPEKSDIFWQDEILQVMYWMFGEGFGERITVTALQRFLDAPEAVLEGNLNRLVANGLVTLGGGGDYLLTETGVREGGRRFADEFEGLLQQGHYECNDPDCDCHSPGFTGQCQQVTPHHAHQST